MQNRSIFKRSAMVLIGVVLLAALLWTVARALPLTAEQRAAIALLEQAPEFPGRNAFGLLWTMGNAVPADRIEAVLAEDARRIAEFRSLPPNPSMPTAPVEWAREDDPAVEISKADRALFCGERDASCIERVTNDTEAYRALIERHGARLDRIESLADYGHIDLPWSYGFDFLDIPPLGGFGDTRTRHALRFVEGRIDQALALSCRAIDTWRRLGRNSDSLILRMTANAYAIRHHGAQVAEMLAAVPPGQPLPAACETALAPPEPAELSLCNAMRGEFEIVRDSERMVRAAAAQTWFGELGLLGYDFEAMGGSIAENHARQCTDAALARIEQDLPKALPPEASSWRFSCLGNLIGCRLEALTTPNYNDYHVRMLDFGFQLRALATLAWLHREHPGEPVTEALLQARPDALKSPARELIAIDDGAALEVPLYSEYPLSSWRLPLHARQ